MLSVVECLGLFGLRQRKRLFTWTILISAAYFFHTFLFCLHHGKPYFSDRDIFYIALHVLGVFTLLLFRPLDGKTTLWAMLGAVFSFLYVPFLFNFVTRVLFMPSNGEQYGAYLIYLLLVSKFTDAGAYLTGTLWGKHKAIPHISPGKTWEGLAGGVLTALAVGFSVQAIMHESLSALTPVHVVATSLLLALGAVIGDLAESIIKRCLGKKDSGAMLPGIGGALDLIDSLCFTAPMMYLYINYFLNKP